VTEEKDQELTVEKVNEEQVEEPQETVAELSLEERLAEVELELAAVRATAEENLDGWQRSLADFSNYKKRVEKEHAAVYKNALGRAVLRYLEIKDDLELALKNRPKDGDGAKWAVGIELILRKFQGFLETEGVLAIDAEGQMFDPNVHEAISMEPSEDHESGQIIEVVQTGYQLGDRVLRPARVRVAQ
jgi:molecular chaperone GrpE